MTGAGRPPVIGPANGPIERIDWRRPGFARFNARSVKSPLKTTLAATVAGLLASVPAAAQTTQTAPATPTFSVSVTEASELVEEVGTTRRIGRTEIEARNA